MVHISEETNHPHEHQDQVKPHIPHKLLSLPTSVLELVRSYRDSELDSSDTQGLIAFRTTKCDWSTPLVASTAIFGAVLGLSHSIVSHYAANTAASLALSSSGRRLLADDDDEAVKAQDVIFFVIGAICCVAASVLLTKLCKSYKVQKSLKRSVQKELQKRESWKIEFSELKMGKQIGVGSQGQVHLGTWRGQNVAVKQLSKSLAEDSILLDAKIMKQVRHPKLVLFMGMTSAKDDRYCLVHEYMNQGSLYKLLHNHDVSLDWQARCRLLCDVAQGLAYMHSLDASTGAADGTGLVHQDLRSTNILVSMPQQQSKRSGLVFRAKVSDYGMVHCRGDKNFENTAVTSAPLWTAPEVISTIRHTVNKKQDVYSFAIIMWEVFTRRTPYSSSTSNGTHPFKLIKEVVNGRRPTIPARCPRAFADIMKACWQEDSSRRPSFRKIIPLLERLRRADFRMDELEDKPRHLEVPQVSAPELRPWMIKWSEIEIGHIIGYGSFGEVYSGRFRGKEVAVKKLHSGAVSHRDLVDFVHELQIMSELRHPNTVLFMGACIPDIDSAADEQHTAIVMEKCEHGSVYDLLHDKSVVIDYHKILKILPGVAAGMSYLHCNDPPILHRDLKSLNILVDSDWNAKIADFGLTKFKSSKGQETNIKIGTPLWLAPEVIDNQAFSEASDVYSFGMICWEMFTREDPFPDMSPMQAVMAVLSDDLRPEIPKYVPQNFQDLIRSCWQRDAQRRPTFGQIIEALAEIEKQGLPRLDLHEDNAQLHQKRTTVHAFPSHDPVIVYKTWGVGESQPGDYVVVGPGHDVYTCDRAIFEATYAKVGSEPHLYRKTGKIWARCMPDDFLVTTMEGMEHGQKGDFLAQNPVTQEQWPIDSVTFNKTYEACPPGTKPDAPMIPAPVTLTPKAPKLHLSTSQISTTVLPGGIEETSHLSPRGIRVDHK